MNGRPYSAIADAEQSVANSGGWCTALKAGTLASLVVALRPRVVCEIGVWTGSSLLPMLIALRQTGSGRAIAIDPWSATCSVQGETDKNAAWWGSVDHDAALERFRQRMAEWHVTDLCDIWRQPSDECTPPSSIDMLHIDGSHTDQAMRDATRFGAAVRVGGIMILDDLEWTGGGVDRAVASAHALGFVDLYRVEQWLVTQRIAVGSAG